MGRPTLLNDALAERIERELEDGVPAVVVAQRVNVSPRTIRSWLKAGKVVRRKPASPLDAGSTVAPAVTDLDARGARRRARARLPEAASRAPSSAASTAALRRRGSRRSTVSPLLADAIEATLPPREDRDPDAPLFPGVTDARLRMAITRACKAAGVPSFAPHALRHRRVSLLHRQGRSWAEIGQLVGQKKLSLTADVYTHVLVDGREADYETLIAA
jgi:integrase